MQKHGINKSAFLTNKAENVGSPSKYAHMKKLAARKHTGSRNHPSGTTMHSERQSSHFRSHGSFDLTPNKGKVLGLEYL